MEQLWYSFPLTVLHMQYHCMMTAKVPISILSVQWRELKPRVNLRPPALLRGGAGSDLSVSPQSSGCLLLQPRHTGKGNVKTCHCYRISQILFIQSLTPQMLPSGAKGTGEGDFLG